MKKVVKLLALLLALVMILGMLSACGGKSEKPAEDTTPAKTDDSGTAADQSGIR